jgi:hypothetical protein
MVSFYSIGNITIMLGRLQCGEWLQVGNPAGSKKVLYQASIFITY